MTQQFSGLGISGGLITTFVGYLTITDWVAIGGLIVAVASLAVNFWYKVQTLKRLDAQSAWERNQN